LVIYVVRIEGMRNAYILVRKPDGKRPFVRPRYRWEDNIKVDLKYVVKVSLGWVHMAHNVK